MPRQPSPPPSNDDASPWYRRHWISLLVAVFLVFQLLTPLRYYLNRPTPDERFAWRMFSTQHMKRCFSTMHQVMNDDGQLREELVPPMVLAPWQRLLDRQRPDVVHQVMRKLADRPNVVGVGYTLDCISAEGEELEPEVWWLDVESNQIHVLEAHPQ